MADFPGKVSTQTSSQEPQRSFGIPSSVDMNFIKSIPGILLLAEIVSWKNFQLHFPCFVTCFFGVCSLASFLLSKTFIFPSSYTHTHFSMLFVYSSKNNAEFPVWEILRLCRCWLIKQTNHAHVLWIMVIMFQLGYYVDVRFITTDSPACLHRVCAEVDNVYIVLALGVFPHWANMQVCRYSTSLCLCVI